MNLEDNKVFFGKYKGYTFDKLPDDYLKWLLENNVAKGKLLHYCKQRLNVPKNTYIVEVTDSVGTDGVYTVEAYDKKNAIRVCQKQHKIVNTQSIHGTEYRVELKH